ncbi:cadherin EGF LAG seven-pass G-type receptor 1-like isoform X1 [Haliotis rufescens]|uniref:cadherin EGF LAG seven-pass G-type receptor 1-like isoform X1 n=2 Tax=Haliotis rufescens TaxID=6454 RepID=UPI00201F3A82|nr:cadherin EGF LAG seven-pass G-type receptor 1-like isoform X1 [Haliotis rufescens]
MSASRSGDMETVGVLGRARRRCVCDFWVSRAARPRTKILVGIVFILHISSALTFDIHMSATDPGGTVLYNGSHGPGWSYTLDRQHSRHALPYLELDSSNGVVYLKQNVQCYHVSENPFNFRVISRIRYSNLISNYTVTPFSVFVHGDKCGVSPQTLKPHRLKDPHFVVVYSNQTTNQCIPRGHHLASLASYIPLSFKQCVIVVDMPVSSDLKVDIQTLEITSLISRCLNGGEIIADFNVLFYCEKSSMSVPYRLVLHSFSGHYSPNTVNVKKHRWRRAIENNPPVFSKIQYVEHVKEEQRPGIVVATITASDPDTQEAGTITYSMVPNRNVLSQNMFSIHPVTGTINTTQTLDREQIAAHYFMLVATDDGREPQTATSLVVIIVDDVNDNPPEFESDHYTRNISEDQHEGYTVLTVQATDKDFGDNADVRYTLINTDGQLLPFMIDPLTGIISTRSVLDRETKDRYHFLVRAVDQGETTKRKSATTTVDIQLKDENDNKPQFVKTAYRVQVLENIDVSSRPVILNISATDIDQGRNSDIRYSMTGNVDNKFHIDSLTGSLSVIDTLDYELYKEYKLNIRAEDSGVPSQKSQATVLVEVLDVNDNAPKFFPETFQESVFENEPAGTPIQQVQAHDRDSGENARLTYSIVDGPANMPLVIDDKTGWIKTSASIDREIAASYDFHVLAKDHGDPPKMASAQVTILVRDINDNAPAFTPKMYQAAVSEEARIGTRVTTVTAIDTDTGDNARVSYDITGGNTGNVFQISPNRGEGIITVQGRLDARTQNRYVLTVSARDSGGKTDSAKVYINVTDTNRNRPAFQGTPYVKRVDENVAVGTSVFKIMALDSDRGENSRITYSIEPASTFTIDPNSGVIKTRALLDREMIPTYMLSVTATDNGVPPLSDTTDMDITVNDINDNKPEFLEQEYEGSIREDELPGTSVLRIQAEDRDQGQNKQIEYTFDGGNNGDGDFKIDSARGIIRVEKELDRERVANYELVAYAIDKGNEPLSTSVKIKIKVEDVNDNQPHFANRVIEAPVPENTPIGSTVCVITATDPDEGENALVEYSFAGGADVDSFRLSGRKGDPAEITSLIDLDFESDKKEYEVTLRAASGLLFAITTVKIKVQDVNDNPPTLKDFMIIFNNYPHSFPSGSIGRVPAYDPDEIDRPRLVYRFVSGNEARLLHLNESSGEITLDARLNSDVPRLGSFEVSVSDGLNEVKAGCKLFVRLVTEDMLLNSITIRLDRMTEQAFLSPLFKFFVDALASILHVEDTKIFVINVEDDIDVPGQVLNVTVSVQKDEVNVRGGSKDVFYPPEFVQENIYLQRSMLANLSTLQVLPFDDNLCMREMCYNFEVCQTKLVFDLAADFIKSDTMLFRSIHPENGYRCVCPIGFTGQRKSNLCDVEVDLCYSKPCLNRGKCLPREGGYTCVCTESFTGSNCEVNQTARFDPDTCPPNLCQPPSRCVPLIKGGFRCDGCPSTGDYDQFCRLTKRSFSKGSFLSFPSLKRRNHFTITLEFATQEKNGLLFYNGRFNELHDFIALEIIDGQIQFSYSLGADITTVNPYVRGGVNTGEWVKVKVNFLNREATVTVGEDCDTLVSILYHAQLGNYSCADRNATVLDKICENPTKICHRLLDLTGPLQIGGLPSLPTTFQIVNKDFVGCIKDFYIDHDILNLNSSVSYVGKGSEAGCSAKKSMCSEKPCRYGGICKEGWTTFTCECRDKAGGKDCSQVIESPRKLKGNGYLSYSNFGTNNKVSFPWYNGLAFRTRADSGALMQINLSVGQVTIMIEDGFITYNFKATKIVFDFRKVNDGKWHYFESRWFQGRQELTLDYGQLSMEVERASTIKSSVVSMVYVGATRQGNEPVKNGFHGCVKDIRMGNYANTVLNNPNENNVEAGCESTEKCLGNVCGIGTCVDEWEDHSCDCPPGFIGPDCKDICTSANPCQNYSTCRRPNPQRNFYSCECGARQRGDYCEVTAPKECPASWYGYPVCGPCNCRVDRGFDSACNKTSGECICKANHYRPAGSEVCYPCNCYHLGASGATCHPVTGQCTCKSGIVGRRCDQCPSIFAEIREDEGCHVVYAYCPRNYAAGIWWDPVSLGDQAVIDCPGTAIGDAVRKCLETDSWLEPDLYNCTSANFTKLQASIAQLNEGSINTFVAKTSIDSLRNATNTTRPMYGGDISTAYQIIYKILKYEVKQKGLSLTNEQHGTYIQEMLVAVSNVTEPETKVYWDTVNTKWDGASKLLNLFEEYLVTLATNFASTKTPAFDAISDNMVLGVDWIAKDNITKKTIPKYDHIQKKGTFDDDSNIKLPMSIFKPVTAGTHTDNSVPKAYVGYILYRTMGNILPKQFSPSVRVMSDIPVVINSPVMTVVIVDEGKVINGSISTPVNITLKQLYSSNRTGPQCVYWKHDTERSGFWSPDGCSVIDQYTKNGEDYVVCSCKHLSTFALLMDVAGAEYLYSSTVQLEVLTYILVVISMACLVFAFFVFMVFKRLQCNWNSIHINIIFVLFITQLSFIIGIDRVGQKLFCKLVSISLHYFYVSAFAWLFVDVLHIYRMLTEMRIINYGSMKFYYLVGYVVPGIIVGLSVGLNTVGYENKQFCWMSVSDMFIWSFAGPICLGVLANIFTFILAMKASCREKIREPENLNTLRCGLLSTIILLLLVGVTWVTGLISVNFHIPSLNYVFYVFMFLEGVFIVLAYVLLNAKVRFQIKRAWYRIQGKKLEIDENLAGTRSTMLSRSALAYRHDSSNDGGLHRVNIGISTTSTTSRSSKSSGTFHKGDDYLRSTSSSTSGHVPSTALYPPNTGIPPYGYDPSGFHDKLPDGTNPDTGEITHKPGNDSDSDSEVSIDRNSLDLASSHSSDEDDEFDLGPRWEPTPTKSKAVEKAREEIEKKKKEKELDRLRNNNADGLWSGDGEPGQRLGNSPRLSNVQPDVTLPASERQGRVVTIVPPVRTDSLPNNISSTSSPKQGMRVQVLTHNGSVSSDTESSNETSV